MLSITNGRDRFYQWDVGQSLTVTLAEGESITAVHIGNTRSSELIVVEPEDNIVAIPDALLESGDGIVAYEYLEDGDDGHTVSKAMFEVIKRAKATEEE